MPAEPRLGRALAVYTALRLGLMAVLSVLAWLAGLPWLPAVTTGVLLAAILSLVVLRAPMRRLSAAIAGSRGGRPARSVRTAGSDASGERSGSGADSDSDDPYAFDPYADDDEDDDDPEAAAPGRSAAAAQETSSSATPTSRP